MLNEVDGGQKGGPRSQTTSALQAKRITDGTKCLKSLQNLQLNWLDTYSIMMLWTGMS